jgi:anti-sigma factor RsiW
VNCKEAQEKIDVYLDRELTLSDSRDFETHLDQCENCQLTLKSARALNTSVQKIAYTNTPFSLRHKIKNDLKESAGEEGLVFNKLQLLSFAGGSALLASIVAWVTISFVTHVSLQTQLIDELTQAHVHSLMVDHVTDITTSDRHTVKPWFSGRLDFSPMVKDFSDDDFSLLGGRLEYLNKQTAAALVYKKRSHFINVFIFHDNEGDTILQQRDVQNKKMQHQSYNLVNWRNKGLSYWAISDLNREELEQFSQLFIAQLSMPLL